MVCVRARAGRHRDGHADGAREHRVLRRAPTAELDEPRKAGGARQRRDLGARPDEVRGHEGKGGTGAGGGGTVIYAVQNIKKNHSGIIFRKQMLP